MILQLAEIKQQQAEAMSAERREKYKKNFIARLKRTLRLSSSNQPDNMKERRISVSSKEDEVKIKELSTLLSLEMALNLTYVNKKAIRQCLHFARLGGKAGQQM